MKTLPCLCIATLTFVAFTNTPLSGQTTSPAPTATTTATPTVSASPSGDLADKLQQRFEKKFGRHHGVTIDADLDRDEHGDIPAQVIPIIAISLLAVFGTPILIVALAGMFIFSASRQRHRTIRMMVEKGQPVPAELLMAPTRAARQHSDMRRGVIWTMIGIGLMVWLGAVNDWEGGVWSFGLIPFLIGLGYLSVWKLEAKKDVPPPPPVP
jgi:Domain of unknown function (DUF6249)